MALDPARPGFTIEVRPGRRGRTAMSGAWGWGGWFVIMLFPLSFWALIVTFLVILFRSEAPVDVAAEEEAPVVQPSRERGNLGWIPPVASHHR
jgi:hypothetical protein